jgi:hypothetical protein
MINSATVRLCATLFPTAADPVGAVAPVIPPGTG